LKFNPDTDDFAGGSFGTLYKGKCFGMRVAIKILRPNDQKSAEQLLREFIKEVNILVQVHHPNVVLLMGACAENGKLAIVSELLKRDLDNILKYESSKLTLPLKFKISKDICQGTEWLHGKKIIHRDLKPANVLLDEYWNAKICDFGLSDIKKNIDPTRIRGSYPWMSPEALQKPGEIDERTDVYSIGIIIWQIMTGKSEIYPGYENSQEFAQAICLDAMRPEIKKNQIPATIRFLIQSCWHQDKKKRDLIYLQLFLLLIPLLLII